MNKKIENNQENKEEQRFQKNIKKTDNGIYKKYGKHIRKTDSHVFIVNNSDIFDKSDDILLYYRHKSR